MVTTKDIEQDVKIIQDALGRLVDCGGLKFTNALEIAQNLHKNLQVEPDVPLPPTITGQDNVDMPSTSGREEKTAAGKSAQSFEQWLKKPLPSVQSSLSRREDNILDMPLSAFQELHMVNLGKEMLSEVPANSEAKESEHLGGGEAAKGKEGTSSKLAASFVKPTAPWVEVTGGSSVPAVPAVPAPSGATIPGPSHRDQLETLICPHWVSAMKFRWKQSPCGHFGDHGRFVHRDMPGLPMEVLECPFHRKDNSCRQNPCRYSHEPTRHGLVAKYPKEIYNMYEDLGIGKGKHKGFR